MQIAYGAPRTVARSIRSHAQIDWRPRYRTSLIACAAAAMIALSSGYRTADAQIHIIDVNYTEEADALYAEVDRILNTEKCLFEFRAEELTKRLKDTRRQVLTGRTTVVKAYKNKQISYQEYGSLFDRGTLSETRLEVLVNRIEDFPRCLNFVGSPPGRLKMQADERPEIGRVIVEPKISVGLAAKSGNPTYDSTGGQVPFNGDSSQTTGQVCGGVTLWPGFAVGAIRAGFDVNLCSGPNAFGSGDTTLFKIMRHGPGDVELRSSTSVIFDVLLKGEMRVGPTNNLFLSAGIGPTVRNQSLTLTSDQSFFGGGIASTSAIKSQPGIALMAGVATSVACPICAGVPVRVGVEGRARLYSAESISLRSPLGFVETGSTGRTTDYSALVTFGVPISWVDGSAR